MRRFCKASVALSLLLAGSAMAAPAGRQLAPEERAALRTHAEGMIAEELTLRAVRPAPAGQAEKDAARLASSLSDGELSELLQTGSATRLVNRTADALRSISASALGDATSDLVFVPLPPCRVIDTRKSGAGAINAGVIRDFQVAGVTQFPAQGGKEGGCGIPAGTATPMAPAVVFNFVAVGPLGPGHLEAWAYGQPVPTASVINYAAVPGLNIANGVVVPIAGTNLVPADLHIRANVSATHVVADVTGYFTRFPVEQFASTTKSITVTKDGGALDLSTGACTEVNSCTITADASGKVIVRTWTQVSINHTGGSPGGDRIAVGVKNLDPTVCSNNDQSINATDFEVPEPQGTDPDVETTLSHKRIFSQGKGTRTYYINARMVTGASAGDTVESSRMICTFIPD
jgi:hypothetical protein